MPKTLSRTLFGAAALLASVVAAHAATIEVAINGLAFTPAEVQAKPGDTIRWKNNDILVHSATARGKFDVNLPVKASGTVTVKEPGVIEYLCRYHPNMKGRITVAP